MGNVLGFTYYLLAVFRYYLLKLEVTNTFNGTKQGTKLYFCLRLVENSSRTNQERTTTLTVWWAGGNALVHVAGRTLNLTTPLNLFKPWKTDKNQITYI